MSFWQSCASCLCCFSSKAPDQQHQARTKPNPEIVQRPNRNTIQGHICRRQQQTIQIESKQAISPPERPIHRKPNRLIPLNHNSISSNSSIAQSSQERSLNPSLSKPRPPSPVRLVQIDARNINIVILPPQPPVPLIPVPPNQNANLIQLTIKTINKDQKKVFVDRNITGSQLKQLIFNNHCQSLKVNEMSITYEGNVIGNNRKISDLRLVVGESFTIVQTKIQLSEAQNIIADIHGIDLISDEVGTAKMSCGHNIGRDTMTVMVRSLISILKYQIRCPYPDENNQTCNAIWEFKQCRKVGVFTLEESEQFEKGLSINWIKENTKTCPNPKCCQTICKNGLKTNRVVCPSCKYGDFCYICLKKWTGSSSDFCGNQQCRFRNDFVAKCPWNRIFELRDKADNNTVKKYATPQYRACPHCCMVIEHREACKHMKCKGCGFSFCWVCLGICGSKGWPCGGFNEYCGKVAQVQNIVPTH